MRSRWSSTWLGLGERLLRWRWGWISLASLSVFFFEYREYQPFQNGTDISFFFEITFYGIVLPVSTGLALTALAGSRAELVWTAYYQDLIPNLGLQLHNINTYDELAKVYLQFVRVMIPVIGVTMYKYEQNGNKYETILKWSLENEFPFPDFDFSCTSGLCPFITVGDMRTGPVTPQLCRDPHIMASSQKLRIFCVPFLFSNSIVAGARLYFPFGKQPSAEQMRLLKEIAPTIASTFQRVQLERLMKRQGDEINAEQQRIARDVHDTLGHSLAYLRLRLDQISMESDQAETNTFKQEVEALRDVAKDAYDQMREVLIRLTPDPESKLSNTLANYANKISQQSNFKVRIYQHGKPCLLPPLIQRNIFYIFQEALTNIEKHAHAQQVDVNVDWQERCLKIQVVDDGVGYDPTLQISNGHFGLQNMRDRALESNAQLSISSQPGQGTCLELQLPYEEAT
jgi:signal transduction histidine kinase